MSRFNPSAPALTGTPVRITVRGNFKGQAVENIFDYVSRAPVALNPTILLALATSWDANNTTAYQACFTADYTSSHVLAADIGSGLVPTQFLNVAGGGTVSGFSYPSYVSAVTEKATTLRGQHGRGRMYVGPVPLLFVTPATDPDTLDATGIAAYQGLRTSLLAPLNVAATLWDWSVLTRPAAPLTLYTHGIKVDTAPVVQQLGTTRRRIVGRGI